MLTEILRRYDRTSDRHDQFKTSIYFVLATSRYMFNLDDRINNEIILEKLALKYHELFESSDDIKTSLLRNYGSNIKEELASRGLNVPPEKIIDRVLKCDPTSDKKYSDWLIKIWISGELYTVMDLSGEVYDQLERLETFLEKKKAEGSRIPYNVKSISVFKTYKDLNDYLNMFDKRS